MANIKVSEMTEATIFDDGDYTMIVQANQSKKISKENLFDSIEDEISATNTTIGDLTELTTVDKNTIVDSINSLIPIELYSDNDGSLSVTLSDSAENYSELYIETIGLQYTDYIKRYGFTIKNPNGKYISQSYGHYNFTNNQIYVVNPIFYINGTSITISNNQAGAVGSNNAYAGTNNCIGITKVLGYK